MRKNKSYKGYDPEEVDKKSRNFLKRIMGDEKFNSFQKDGKVEIEANDESNEKIIYELYTDGHVINKTKGQSYCLVADRFDYPTDDMIAIKYAWLTHKSEIAEKVANKTNLYTGVIERTIPDSVVYADFIREMEQRGWSRQQVEIDNNSVLTSGAPWYGDYVDYLSGIGWHRELITIDQDNTSLVNIQGLSKKTTGNIVDVICPAERKISIMGTQQVPRSSDVNLAYSLGLYITDENGEEIPDDTKLRITKVKPSDDVIQLSRIFYLDAKMKDGDARYRFSHGIELNGSEHLTICLINSKSIIPIENINFKMEADIWSRYE